MVRCRDGDAKATCGEPHGAQLRCIPTGLHIVPRDNAECASPIRRIPNVSVTFLGAGWGKRIALAIDQLLLCN
jgi:hypothetical protein